MAMYSGLQATDLFDRSAFNQQLAAGGAISACKSAIHSATACLHHQFVEGADVAELIVLRAQFMDTLLACLWESVDWHEAELALVAVGGYGRGELLPHSDIDLLILLGDHCQNCSEKLSQFLTLLWDIGLNIGHSVRTVDECIRRAEEDI
ncbi:MAG: [protein-PII] uridylyltransferase, partial [Halieaceae bacterium]|nr:[protein-PII] uridylyltransferase [Halieaceae bacterium]